MANTSRQRLTGVGRRDLRLLAVGVAVSTAGDSVAMVALLLRLRSDGSGWVAALLAAQLVPIVLLAGRSGRIVDRFETRAVLLVALAGQALVALPLAFVRADSLIVALFALLTMFTAVVRPATAALVPTITGQASATVGYAQLATGTSLGWIVGPAAGGLITAAFGVTVALLVDAATFIALGAACGALHARRVPAAHDHADRHVSGGLSLLWNDAILRVTLTISGISIACAMVDNVAAPFRFINQLHCDATGYGAYLAIWGAGVLVGSQLPRRVVPTSLPRAAVAGNAIAGIGIAGIGLAGSLPVALAASLLGGTGNGLANVAQNSLVGHRVPDSLRGRAFAANGAVMQTATGLGTAAGGPLVAAIAANRTMIALGGLGALCALVGLAQLGALTHLWPAGEPET